MRHPGAVHPSIGSQAPPNNTQHKITTHFYHIHIFLHTKAAVKHLYSSLFPVENAVEKSCCRGPLQQLYKQHYSGSTVYRLYSILYRNSRGGKRLVK